MVELDGYKRNEKIKVRRGGGLLTRTVMQSNYDIAAAILFPFI